MGAKKKLGNLPKAPRGKSIVIPSRGRLPGADNSDQRLSWRFAHVDHEGPWGFDKVNSGTLVEILGKLREFERFTLNELRNTSGTFESYELPAAPLCKEAYERLDAMRRDDMTEIHRLRFQGAQRLYGFLDGNVFHVVWWDPEHKVYPWKPKNT
ncbi:hypothetical protein ABZW02_20225 [Streptomyces sp. NPDC005180]|uniref:hypothetical protein n=1 Tax=Streptomyces sp. NPDC005180 TaxID=3156868 RepID=UPI0033B50509